jgi:hypothetical protein
MRRAQGDRRVLLYPGAVGTRGEEPAGKVDDHDRAALVAGEKATLALDLAAGDDVLVRLAGRQVDRGRRRSRLRAAYAQAAVASRQPPTGSPSRALLDPGEVLGPCRLRAGFSEHSRVGGQLGEQVADLIGIGGL